MDGWEQWKGNSEHDHKAVLCGCLYVCAYGDLLKRPFVVLCVLPQSPRQAWQTSRPLKHTRSCCSSDSLSFSRMRSTWIWAVSVSVCLPALPPQPHPTGPLCLSVCGRSTPHLPSTLCVAILRFSFSTSGQSLFTSQFAQKWTRCLFISHHLPPYVDC